MRFPLPNLTGSCAHDAKPIGAFGLVTMGITIAYHVFDLGLGRPGIAFTNHYHRTGGEGGQATDVSVVAGWDSVARVITA
jgi:hypothetical protein